MKNHMRMLTTIVCITILMVIMTGCNRNDRNNDKALKEATIHTSYNQNVFVLHDGQLKPLTTEGIATVTYDIVEKEAEVLFDGNEVFFSDIEGFYLGNENDNTITIKVP